MIPLPRRYWLVLCPVVLLAQNGSLPYPSTRKVDHVDTYHGVKINDPYRWLEDDTSAETAAWVKEQNKVTFGYLEKIPFRKKIYDRLLALNDYPKYGSPFRRAGLYFFSKNDGLQNQSVMYVQKGLDGTPEVLLDPNSWSKDGTTRLGMFSIPKDAKYLVYGQSKGGSDWQEYFVMDLATRKMLDDHLKWVKVSGVSWVGSTGFYYSRYPAPAPGKELSSKNENHQVFFHKIGTPQSEDKLVYEDAGNPQRFHNVSVTEDQRYALLNISDRGKGKDGNAIFYMDLKDPAGSKQFQPVIGEVTNEQFGVITTDAEGGLIVETNRNAANSRVVRIDPKKPAESEWKTIIPENKDLPLRNVSTSGRKLFAQYLKDVTTRVAVYSLSGKHERDIQLPGLGTAGGFGGNFDDTTCFYTFTSITTPPTIFSYDIASGASKIFRQPEVKFNPDSFTTEQVFYPSKDGTKIPMFITHRKGLKRDGSNPTMLYAYGGFNISSMPTFSAAVIPWLEMGGIWAVANIRGGAEYGEVWHKAGMRFQKQNVFDDFISAGEYLIAQKYTRKERLALRGGSNGGLLVGTVINQRPDLAQVAIPQVGVMDMLRFHKFTIGWNWIAEYGSSDNDEDFKNLRRYSPLHNIQEAKYPATLITTADHDDRVVPAHSFKYAATLQEKQRGSSPTLIRIETNSGHGASNLRKGLEVTADIFAFSMHEMGFAPVLP
jgi:prolyl oligopeptidase